MFRFCFLILLICYAPIASADVSGTVRVIDGDTFDVGGVRVRLHGLDAPEQAQECETDQGTSFACGAWVTTTVAGLYDGRQAFCAQVDRDRYGRVVGRCQIGGEDVGARIVGDGLAFAYRKYSLVYDLDEKSAAVNDRGLHAYRVQSPAQFRATRTKGRLPPDGACRIKGDISQSGRIFHVPGQADYTRTGINLAKGERWFCSEAEARAAGWRKARR